jgi:hypothetical protein
VSTDVSRAIVTAVLGLLTAGILAVINNGINSRAGIDENLRTARLAHYPDLWSQSGAVSRWPRMTVHRSTLEALHRALRSWYYGEGGLFLSAQARERYGELQELIAVLVDAGEDRSARDELSPASYSHLMETASALRTALTEDLDTRRRKSAWESRRRARWHSQAALSAKERISRAKAATPEMHWVAESDG